MADFSGCENCIFIGTEGVYDAINLISSYLLRIIILVSFYIFDLIYNNLTPLETCVITNYDKRIITQSKN
jgi:hypothetical protein